MKIGLYGGTFSPPHMGHIRAAELFKREAELDELIVMPGGVPPHKKEATGADKQQRLEMTRLAFLGIGRVSDWEMKKEGKSYTVETLKYLSGEYPTAELLMLVGTDMLMCLDKWYKPEEIMKLCGIYVISREEKELEMLFEKAEELEKSYSARITVMPAPPLEISSTEVREKIAAGKSIREYVVPAVAEYIEKNGLYGKD